VLGLTHPLSGQNHNSWRKWKRPSEPGLVGPFF
jgi:hypothetical protein